MFQVRVLEYWVASQFTKLTTSPIMVHALISMLWYNESLTVPSVATKPLFKIIQTRAFGVLKKVTCQKLMLLEPIYCNTFLIQTLAHFSFPAAVNMRCTDISKFKEACIMYSSSTTQVLRKAFKIVTRQALTNAFYWQWKSYYLLQSRNPLKFY